MTIFEFYILFCITTSIVAILDLFWPAIVAARKEAIKNEITEYPLLSVVVFFCINLIIAPLLFLVVIVPSLNASATTGLNKVIREPTAKI